MTKSLFCSFENQVVFIEPVACRVLFKNRFPKFIKLVKKTFLSVFLLEIYVSKQKKTHESTQNLPEKDKIYSRSRNRDSDVFCTVSTLLIAKIKTGRNF